ncbi:hypothetical protein DFJ74DRAFT_678036 [Hyaloraphidium curvatum]|nr:hypothetical protein DFJ74DRAFT_678036 [Hyaloraphidium curvatum]
MLSAEDPQTSAPAPPSAPPSAPLGDAPKKFGAFGPRKTASEAAVPAIDLFASRNAAPAPSPADLERKADVALTRAVEIDVPKGDPNDPEAVRRTLEMQARGVKPGSEFKPNWTGKWGPYEVRRAGTTPSGPLTGGQDNRLLLADVLKQVAKREFDATQFDSNAKFKANAMNKAWRNILAWHEEIKDGKTALKEIDGCGKSIAEKIDKILKDVGAGSFGETTCRPTRSQQKCLESRDMVFHPDGQMSFDQMTKKDKEKRGATDEEEGGEKKKPRKRAAADDGGEKKKPAKSRKKKAEFADDA